MFWYKLNEERQLYFKGFKWTHRQTLNFIYVLLSKLTDSKRENNFGVRKKEILKVERGNLEREKKKRKFRNEKEGNVRRRKKKEILKRESRKFRKAKQINLERRKKEILKEENSERRKKEI